MILLLRYHVCALLAGTDLTYNLKSEDILSFVPALPCESETNTFMLRFLLSSKNFSLFSLNELPE